MLRAAACGLIALLAIGTGRRRSLLPALAAAVLLLVLYDPWLARSYGFLLSVLATGALLTLAPRWSAALRRRRVPPRLAEALAAAAAAQAVCAPVVAVLSARVSLVAVPCNLLAEFAVAPATVLGFAALAAAPVAMPVAKALAWCAGWPAGWIAAVARTGAALPGAGVDWPGSWSGRGCCWRSSRWPSLLVGRRLLRHPWLVRRRARCCWCCGGAAAAADPGDHRLAAAGLAVGDVRRGPGRRAGAGGGRTAAGWSWTPGPNRGSSTAACAPRASPGPAARADPLPRRPRGRAARGAARAAVGAIETTGFDEPADQAAFVRRQAAAGASP